MVVEIDLTCLDSNSRLFSIDLSSMCVVVEKARPSGVPEDIVVSNVKVHGRVLCSAFMIMVLWAWPRVSQLDALGNLRPFFPHPPGPGNGNGGPHGPPSCRGRLPTFGPVLPSTATGLSPWANGGPGFIIPGFDTRLHSIGLPLPHALLAQVATPAIVLALP
jgi:hypothetical protein